MGRDARELDEARRDLSRERHTVRGVLGILADAGDVRCDDAEAGVRALVAQRDEARAEVERLRGLLRRVEWVEDLDGLVCPLCGQVSDLDGGHAPDCELAYALDHRERE